jgi:hypothetical protein
VGPKSPDVLLSRTPASRAGFDVKFCAQSGTSGDETRRSGDRDDATSIPIRDEVGAGPAFDVLCPRAIGSSLRARDPSRGGLVVRAEAHRAQLNEHDGQDLPLGRVNLPLGCVISPYPRAFRRSISTNHCGRPRARVMRIPVDRRRRDSRITNVTNGRSS